MKISQPTDIHGAVEEAFNAGDLEGLARLYEKDARMVKPDGTVAEGTDAIREQWQGFLAMNGRMTLKTRFVAQADDIALLRNDWSFTAPDVELSSSASEVVRRQPDGTWLYIIDHPFGSSEMIP
jgi:uncharacterized protein (TIGR02246 family)